ncbi:hypothetical protein IKF15_00980 [Candidatus Saccharibacteria bacterium]|nr:hypothetical protein [Candidatus Saccharibacteria bacterium]
MDIISSETSNSATTTASTFTPFTNTSSTDPTPNNPSSPQKTKNSSLKLKLTRLFIILLGAGIGTGLGLFVRNHESPDNMLQDAILKPNGLLLSANNPQNLDQNNAVYAEIKYELSDEDWNDEVKSKLEKTAKQQKIDLETDSLQRPSTTFTMNFAYENGQVKYESGKISASRNSYDKAKNKISPINAEQNYEVICLNQNDSDNKTTTKPKLWIRLGETKNIRHINTASGSSYNMALIDNYTSTETKLYDEYATNLHGKWFAVTSAAELKLGGLEQYFIGTSCQSKNQNQSQEDINAIKTRYKEKWNEIYQKHPFIKYDSTEIREIDGEKIRYFKLRDDKDQLKEFNAAMRETNELEDYLSLTALDSLNQTSLPAASDAMKEKLRKSQVAKLKESYSAAFSNQESSDAATWLGIRPWSHDIVTIEYPIESEVSESSGIGYSLSYPFRHGYSTIRFLDKPLDYQTPDEGEVKTSDDLKSELEKTTKKYLKEIAQEACEEAYGDNTNPSTSFYGNMTVQECIDAYLRYDIIAD